MSDDLSRERRLAEIRARVAAEFARLDAHQWGYDHGFCADPEADEETASFVDAALAVVQPELGRLAAERDRFRAAWLSARGRAGAYKLADGLRHAVRVALEQFRRADAAEAERDAALSDAEQLRAECERRAKEINLARDGSIHWAERARAAEAKVRAIEAIHCWRNEDGNGFLFAADVRGALGYTPNETKETTK